MAVAAFGGGPAGCPLTSGPVAGQRDDLGGQGFDLVFRAGGTMPAVRAAGVGGDVAAAEGEHRGERDEFLFTINGVSSALADYLIDPDPGSANPRQRSARYSHGAFTVTLRCDVAPGQVNGLPIAPAGTAAGTAGVLVYRVYLPAKGFSRGCRCPW